MENLDKQVLEKIIPFQKKIELLENSLDEKNKEISLLNYVFTYIFEEVEKISLNKRISIPPEIGLQLFFKKENQFNEFLGKIKSDSLFSCFDFFSLVQMRLVCKKWDFLISDYMLRAFQSVPVGTNKELRENILQELNQFTISFRDEINKIDRIEIQFLKSMNKPPAVANDAFIFFYMSLGQNITKELREPINVCLTKVKDYNMFINEALNGLISKHLTQQKLADMKKFLEDHPNLNSENCFKVNRNLDVILKLGLLKMKYEQILNENFGEMKFLTLPRYKNFFERFKANKKIKN